MAPPAPPPAPSGPDEAGPKHDRRLERRRATAHSPARVSPHPGAATVKVAWFSCFSGIAGDMALGALLDAGADVDEVCKLVDRLGIAGWSIEPEPVLRAGLAATQAGVRIRDDQVHRTFAAIRTALADAELPPRVHQRSLATFVALAEVEGTLHRRPPDQVHFHEVGSLDAIVDVVGTCAALEVLGVDQVWASAVSTGTGMVRSAHGLLPNPAPATIALLARAGAPTQVRNVTVELTTPTGAALLAALVEPDGFGPLPPIVPAAVGYGAGTRELEDMPNVTQVVVGTAVQAAPPPIEGEPMVVVEANVDDATGEALGHTVTVLLEAGAADAWLVPVGMKKGRPGHVVSALCDVGLAPAVAAVLAAETGSLGVRATRVHRLAADRRFDEVEVGGEPVRVKVSPGRAKAEFDDAARAARALGRPAREVVQLAEEAWRRRPVESGLEPDAS